MPIDVEEETRQIHVDFEGERRVLRDPSQEVLSGQIHARSQYQELRRDEVEASPA